MEGICEVCRIPARQACSACKLVHYCSQEHQREHWKQIHKKECCPYSLANDECLGRHLVAKRPINEGRIIFVEEPLVVAPKWYLSESERSSPVHPCVGCYKACSIQQLKCPKCHWPVCATNCSGLTDSNLHSEECEILSVGLAPRSSDVNVLLDYYRPDALLVLRCLLLQKHSPDKWLKLMDMQSHEEERLGTDLHRDANERVVSYLQKQILERLRKKTTGKKTKRASPLDHVTDELLHRICGIIETNYMCISVPDKMELSGLFFTACMMEHSCEPNCYFQFDGRRGFRISVIAGKDIAAGEHLRIMYTNMLWATHMRQEHLALTKHFVCGCQRCQDPTELGSFLGALRCTKKLSVNGMETCNGFQLPQEPLNPTTLWICSLCGSSTNHQQVKYLLTQITAEVEDFMAMKPTLMQVQKMIDKMLEWLHSNHFHIFSLKHLLVQLYGNVDGFKYSALDTEQLNRKFELCEELLDICSKIDPHTIRLALYVAVLLYESVAVLMERFKRSASSLNTLESNQLLSEARQRLNHALRVLKKEQDNTSGQRFVERIQNTLQNLQIITEQTAFSS